MLSEMLFQTSDDDDGILPRTSYSPTQQFNDKTSSRQLADLTNEENKIFRDCWSQLHEFPRVSIKEYIQDTENQFDHHFGIHPEMESEQFTIGELHIDPDGTDMIMNGVRYNETFLIYKILFRN